MLVTKYPYVVFINFTNPLYEDAASVFLYVKEHTITKLKYFGKTIKDDPVAYPGSGQYWRNHINKYGKNFVETLKVWEFNCLKDATEFALCFSAENNIVDSKEWANQIPENALGGGGNKGISPSHETRNKISKARKGKRASPEANKNNKEAQIKRHLTYKDSDETRRRKSDAGKGKTKSDEHRNNLGLAQKKRFKNPLERQKSSDAAKNRFKNPLERQKSSDAAKNRFKNPLERQKLSDAMKNRSLESREKHRKAIIGYKHYNNGVTNKMFKENPGPLWFKGRIKVNS